jgi:DNA-binding GntR family transcriptional regulator
MIDQRFTAAGRAAEVLRRRIVEGSLSAGSRLDLRRLAAELGISRLPLRDALIVLAAEGYVTATPRKGVTVVESGEEDRAELFDLRWRLEPRASAVGAERVDDAGLAHMGAMLDAMEAAASDEEWHDANDEFHDVLLRASGRVRTLEIVHTARALGRPVIRVTPELRRQAEADHRLIVAAVVAGNRIQVQELMSAHLTVWESR